MNILKRLFNGMKGEKPDDPPAEPVSVPAAPETDPIGTIRYNKTDDHIIITGCSAKEVSVVIPAEIEGLPVTVIEQSAFSQNRLLKKAVIPNSVTLIGSCAFEQSGLESVTMSRSVTYICCAAFKNRSGLRRKIRLPV